MNLSNINPNIPCLRNLTCIHCQNRQTSLSTNSKSTYSSSSIILSSNKSRNFDRTPLLIQLCIYSDENSACRTMRVLLSSRYHYSPNVSDKFGCNVLMYCLRYQRYRLFEFLLNEIDLNLNFHAKDQQGNTILHYAILYSGNDTQIIDRLIEKYKKFAIGIDERNNLGFTPLLLAIFCGRYDLVLTLLTKTDASPFVRDHIQFKNIFDYVENDMKNNSQQSPCLNSELKSLRMRLHQTLPVGQETVRHHTYKNFFETILPRAIQDHSESLRLSILELFNFEYSSSNLTHLLSYLNQRYPRIKTPQRQKDSQDNTIITKFIFQRENSKTYVHNILNLFDPNARPNVIPPKPSSIPIEIPTTKTPITFKRLGTKITTLTAFSRMQISKKSMSNKNIYT